MHSSQDLKRLCKSKAGPAAWHSKVSMLSSFKKIVVLALFFIVFSMAQAGEGSGGDGFGSSTFPTLLGNGRIMMEESLALVPWIFRNKAKTKVLRGLEKVVATNNNGGKVSEKDLFLVICSVTPSMFLSKTMTAMNKLHSFQNEEWTYNDEL